MNTLVPRKNQKGRRHRMVERQVQPVTKLQIATANQMTRITDKPSEDLTKRKDQILIELVSLLLNSLNEGYKMRHANKAKGDEPHAWVQYAESTYHFVHVIPYFNSS